MIEVLKPHVVRVNGSDERTHLEAVVYKMIKLSVNPFTARVLDGDSMVTLTFESVDEILRCDHSIESSLPVLSHNAICFKKFHKVKCGHLVEICF